MVIIITVKVMAKHEVNERESNPLKSCEIEMYAMQNKATKSNGTKVKGK